MISKRSMEWAGGLAFLLTAVFAAAQKSADAPAAVPRPGAMIVLPPRLIAGQQATLAVLDATGRLAAGAAVEFTGGERVTTDTTGRATFAAPGGPGVLLARLPGRQVSASTTVVTALANPSDSFEVLDYPRVISLSDRFSVEGKGFRGEADDNRAHLGNQPALILAASPVSLVLLAAPGVAEGPAELVVEAAGHRFGPVRVTLVSLEVTAAKKQLAPNEKGTLSVRVRGTDQRLVIEARNLSPDVVELPRGSVQRVTSSGGPANLAVIEMQGIHPGDFSVGVRVVPHAYGLPDMEAARQRLVAGRQNAPPVWQERLDRVIRRIDRNPQEVLPILKELEKLLAEKPEGDLGREIEAAWRELLKR
ncbi:MAG TPA: carboxypeptidase-like regulatory domain-containing protein [Candidatus Acidoferrales bacterium]|nr:carboxypeptidase-like regulatory domain-containing protein [Candidatus Acidoferrales bacterium]